MRHLHLLLLVLPILAMGCDAVLSVHGRVVDESGAAISGAKVSAFRGRVSAISNDGGCFDFETICPWSEYGPWSEV